METSRKSMKWLVFGLLIASVLFASVFTFTGSVYAQDNQPTATPQAGQTGGTSGGQSGQVPVTGASEFAHRDIRVLTQAEKNRDYTKYGADQQGQEECGQSYAVAPGEYWSLIVVNCDVPLDKLLAANPQVRDQNFLFAGEVLNIPEGSFSEIYAPRTGLPYVFAPRATNSNVPVTGGSNNQGSNAGAQPTATQAAGTGTGTGTGVQPTATQAAGTGALPTATQAAGTGALPTATQAAGTGTEPTATQAAGTGALPTATQAAGTGTGTGTGAQPTATQAAGQGSSVGNNGSVPVTGDAMAAAFARADIRKLTMAEKNRDYTKYDEKQQGQDECGSEYVVARGESWSLIVVNCDVPLDVLLRANGQQDANILFAGQVIKIPAGSFKEITAPTTGLPYAVIPGWQGVRQLEDQNVNNNNQGQATAVPTQVGDMTPVPTLETPVVVPTATGTVTTP